MDAVSGGINLRNLEVDCRCLRIGKGLETAAKAAAEKITEGVARFEYGGAKYAVSTEKEERLGRYWGSLELPSGKVVHLWLCDPE